MADGQVVFEITGDDRKVNQTVKNVTSNIQNEAKKWDQAAKDATGGMENAFSSMLKNIAGMFSAAKIGQALLEWGKAAVDTASDLQEVQNVVDTVFGDGAAKIEAWAKKAGTQFGLTELKAKKFTSTMGAMLSSSGLAGDQIVSMSTDLAGLAADMASFYNLDFEEAFDKIRSGISGQTMPLKTLGIDMSVANLNAFALAQGLEKTYDKMDQGEQTMLRYQYLLQATSNAQGDFEKTSGGFANAQRRIESAIETINTVVGNFLLDPLQKLTGGVADFLEQVTKEPTRTVLDDMADAAAQSQEKIAQIKAITNEATILTQELEKLGTVDPSSVVKGIASGANELNAGAPGLWSSLLKSLTSIDGLENLFGDGDQASKNIESLSQALSGSGIDQSIADAWSTLLTAMNNNAEGVSKLTGKSVTETKKWLSELASAANTLDPNSAEGWGTLLGKMLEGLPGFMETDSGKKFLEGLATNYLVLGNDSEIAKQGLLDLGYASDDITKKQNAWLETCKRLVEIIPGLSSIINTETGEVKGGVQAIQDYVNAWSSENILKARINGLKQQKAILEQAMNVDYDTETMLARAKAKGQLMGREGMTDAEAEAYLNRYLAQQTVGDIASEMGQKNGMGIAGTFAGWFLKSQTNSTFGLKNVTDETNEALKDFAKAEKTASDNARAMPYAIESLDKQIAELEEQTGKTKKELLEMAGAEGDAADGAAEWSDAQKKAGQQAVKAVQEASKAVADYVEKVTDATRQTVNSTLNGFNEVKLGGDDLRKKQTEQADEWSKATKKYSSEVAALKKRYGENWLEKASENYGKLSKKEQEAYNALAKIRKEQQETNKALDAFRPEGMSKNLSDQVKFMQDYLANLRQLKAWGVSDSMLAFLSDGSKDSAEYLAGLVEGGKEKAVELGKQYEDVQKKKEEFTKELTESKLEGDTVYDGLVKKAQDAVESLKSVNKTAGEVTGDMVVQMAKGINDHVGELKAAVDDIETQFKRLEAFGINIDFSSSGRLVNLGLFGLDGSHETGLNYVPFDGYLAELHQGEGILTAEENRIWQRFKNAQGSGLDYEALGGVMRDNVKAGGNVYLDGRTVGQVVSSIQGNQYRTMQRSGWQQ